MHEDHEFAPVYLAPEFAQFGRAELQVAYVRRDAHSSSAHTQDSIQLLDHFVVVAAWQYGGEAKARRVLAADRGEPVIDDARRRCVAGARPAYVQGADGEHGYSNAGFVHRA